MSQPAGLARRLGYETWCDSLRLPQAVLLDAALSRYRLLNRLGVLGGVAPPEDIRATEFMLLHDPEADRSLAMLLFENEEDYQRGDATLNAMPAGDTPGRRTL
jgi:hypothetical protein